MTEKIKKKSNQKANKKSKKKGKVIGIIKPEKNEVPCTQTSDNEDDKIPVEWVDEGKTASYVLSPMGYIDLLIHFLTKGKKLVKTGVSFCNLNTGESCVFDIIGNKPALKHHFLAFSTTDDYLCFLQVPDSEHKKALFTKLKKIISTGEQKIIEVTRIENDVYEVHSEPFDPDDFDDDVSGIFENVIEQIESGKFDFRKLYPSYKNKELKDIPEIKKKLDFLKKRKLKNDD